MEFNEDDAYAVRGWRGIAFHFVGLEELEDEDTDWSGLKRLTGKVLVCMVGDDRVFAVDPDDVTLLPEGAYCGGCGQIGCRAYATS